MRPTDALPHPAAWSTTTVRRSIDFRRGVSWSKEQEHSEPGPDRIPVIGIKNVQARLELDNLLYLSGLRPHDVEKARVSKDWTVIVGSNGNRDRIGNAQLIGDRSDFLFASFLIGARPKPDAELRPDYFFRWLSSAQVQSHLSASAEGSTGLSNLSHSFFRHMSIPVPSLGEQAAIARILAAVDTALERTRETIRSVEVLQAAVLEDAFSSLGAEHCRLGRFSTEVRYGTSVASNHRPDGNPILRIPNVVGDRLLLDDLAYVQQPERDVKRLALSDGDLLLVRTNGNPNYVGRSAVFRRPDNRTWVYASYLIRVRLKEELLPDFANAYLGLERGRRQLLRRVTTSAGNHNINANSIRLIPLPVPPLAEQKRIARLAAAFRDRSAALEGIVDALQSLKASLMQDLLTGKVRVGHGK